jgi:hypothetical protein
MRFRTFSIFRFSAVLLLMCQSIMAVFSQQTPEPTASPTTPPFVPSPTPGDPIDAFDSVFARFEASTLSPLTGQPFTLTLAVSLPDGLEIAEWPLIEDQWGPFEIRDSGEITQTDREVRQSFSAVLWRPEDMVTPETFVAYGAGGADVRRVPVREAFFSVPTVIDPDDENLRPPLPPDLTPWPWPELVVVTGVIGAAGYVIWSRRPRPEPEPPPSPTQIALGRLRGLTKRPPTLQLQSALMILRELNQKMPHSALDAAIATGEALAYSQLPISAEDAAAYLDLAARAVREAGR